MNGYHTDFFSFGTQKIDNFANCFGNGAHRNNHPVGFGIAVVIEQSVFATRNLRHFFEVLFDDIGHCFVKRISSFLCLKINIIVLSCSSGYGLIGAECAITKSSQGFPVYKRENVFVAKGLNLLNFVRGAKSIKKVHKWNSTFERSQMSNGSQIHHLLHRTGGKECKTGRTNCHHILLVAKNGQGM